MLMKCLSICPNTALHSQKGQGLSRRGGDGASLLLLHLPAIRCCLECEV